MWVDLEDLKLLLRGAGEVDFDFPFEYDWHSREKHQLRILVEKYNKEIEQRGS